MRKITRLWLLLLLILLSACSFLPNSESEMTAEEIEAYQSSKNAREDEWKEVKLYEDIHAEDAAKELEKLWAAADPLEEEVEGDDSDPSRSEVQLSAERVHYESTENTRKPVTQTAKQETKAPTVTIDAISAAIEASAPPVPPPTKTADAPPQPSIDPKVEEIAERIDNAGGQQAKKSMLKAEMRKLGYSVKNLPVLKALKDEVPQYLHGMIDDRIDEVLAKKRSSNLQ